MNNGQKAAILSLIKLKNFKMHPLLKPYNLFYSNGVAILSGFHDIPQYEACRGEEWPIGDHFEFYDLKFFKMHPLLKAYNFFYSNGVS